MVKTNKYFDGEMYLSTFWPKNHLKNKMWKDNYFLLYSYCKTADFISQKYKNKFNCLDISTGPVLSPIISFAPILNSIQLSDYCSSGMKTFIKTPSSYWEDYTKEILKLENKRYSTTHIIKRLNLVSKLLENNNFIDVDLKRSQIFFPPINTNKYNLFSMHFVADSITSSKDEYGQIMSKITSLMARKSTIVMSCLIESTKWFVGTSSYPSPNLCFKDIANTLLLNGLKLDCFYIQDAVDGDVGHDGRFAVLAATKI